MCLCCSSGMPVCPKKLPHSVCPCLCYSCLPAAFAIVSCYYGQPYQDAGTRQTAMLPGTSDCGAYYLPLRGPPCGIPYRCTLPLLLHLWLLLRDRGQSQATCRALANNAKASPEVLVHAGSCLLNTRTRVANSHPQLSSTLFSSLFLPTLFYLYCASCTMMSAYAYTIIVSCSCLRPVHML